MSADSNANGDLIIREPQHGLERLQSRPAIDRIDQRTLALIKRQVAQGCTDAEVGHFLELCAHYDLDPFAKEAWCAKSKSGQLLIMVGRDGLRKIAQRQGLHVDGDVVREKDEFAVARTPDGNRTVTHSYSNPAERGAVIGAWAEVREGGPGGKPMGFFYAPREEYEPMGVSNFSPWKKQVGVMNLAAAERQAIRQATPLGGLFAEGEDATVFDAEVVAEDEVPASAPDQPRITEEAALRMIMMLEESGWSTDEQREHLSAVGSPDVTEVPSAVAFLTEEQALDLLSEINSAIDLRAEQASEADEA